MKVQEAKRNDIIIIIFAGGCEQRVKRAVFQTYQLISESSMNNKDPEMVKHENL